MKKADGFVVLTEKARKILFPESEKTGFDRFNRPVEVIPCCVDTKSFEIVSSQNENGKEDKNGNPVFIYVGSFGGWYLTDEMINFLSTAHQKYPKSFTIVLTQRDIEKAKSSLMNAGLKPENFTVKSVSHKEVKRYLAEANVAISFIKKCYSKQASSPTKFAEYLACGLPVVLNSGIGDLDDLVEKEKVGVILQEFTKESYSKALDEIVLLSKDESCKKRCRQVAEKYFDLEKVGGERYRRLYKKLLGENSEN